MPYSLGEVHLQFVLVHALGDGVRKLPLSVRVGERVLRSGDAESTDHVVELFRRSNADRVKPLEILLVVHRVPSVPDRLRFGEHDDTFIKNNYPHVTTSVPE